MSFFVYSKHSSDAELVCQLRRALKNLVRVTWGIAGDPGLKRRT
jgi:hypothetical protein